VCVRVRTAGEPRAARGAQQLMLAWLSGLEVLPDAVVRLTSLGSLTIEWCGKLRALPRGIIAQEARSRVFLSSQPRLPRKPRSPWMAHGVGCRPARKHTGFRV